MKFGSLMWCWVRSWGTNWFASTRSCCNNWFASTRFFLKLWNENIDDLIQSSGFPSTYGVDHIQQLKHRLCMLVYHATANHRSCRHHKLPVIDRSATPLPPIGLASCTRKFVRAMDSCCLLQRRLNNRIRLVCQRNALRMCVHSLIPLVCSLHAPHSIVC